MLRAMHPTHTHSVKGFQVGHTRTHRHTHTHTYTYTYTNTHTHTHTVTHTQVHTFPQFLFTSILNELNSCMFTTPRAEEREPVACPVFEALFRTRFLCELVCYPSSVCERREIAQVAIFSSLVTQLTCIQCRDHLNAIGSLVL